MTIVDSLLGIPYVRNGRSVDVDGGLDCWGLAREVFRRRFGIDLPTYLIDDDGLRAGAFADGMAASEWVRSFKPPAWGLAVFHLRAGEWHCGVVLPDRVRFIHCRQPAVVIEKLDSPIWRNSLKGYFSHDHASH